MNKQVTLPEELFGGEYNLEEIGVISLLLCSPNLKEKNLEHWSKNEYFHRLTKDMIKKGLIIVEDNNNLTINLQTKEKPNMKIIKAIDEISQSLGVDMTDERDLRDILEHLAFEFYTQGYQDAEIDFKDEPEPFTAYGKPEDFD